MTTSEIDKQQRRLDTQFVKIHSNDFVRIELVKSPSIIRVSYNGTPLNRDIRLVGIRELNKYGASDLSATAVKTAKSLLEGKKFKIEFPFADNVDTFEDVSGGLYATLQCYSTIKTKYNKTKLTTYQEEMVMLGYVYYNGLDTETLQEMPSLYKDETLGSRLVLAEYKARKDKRGAWSKEYSGTFVHRDTIDRLNKPIYVTSLEDFADDEYNDIATSKSNDRSKNARSIRSAIIKAKKLSERGIDRRFSDSPLGKELDNFSSYILPFDKSKDIIRKTVNRAYGETFPTQIGAIWVDLPSKIREEQNLGPVAHLEDIQEVRKNGDITPILSQGFLSVMMGDRPPVEGLVLTITIDVGQGDGFFTAHHS